MPYVIQLLSRIKYDNVSKELSTVSGPVSYSLAIVLLVMFYS